MSIKKHIPNTITCLNLLFGCLATTMAFNITQTYAGITGLHWFYIFIAIAAVCDFCDGLSARLLGAYSNLGKELDSLSDLVSFGVAPGMLVYNLMNMYDTMPILSYIAMLIPVMGALRLAKFNVDDSQTTTFTGLPIPANAIFWIGLAAWIERYYYPGAIAMIIAVVIISLLMVSPLRMFSLKFKNMSLYDNVKRYGIIIAAISFVVFYGLSGLAWTILLYILISLFTQKHPD